jgi:hypothetical protein
MQIAPIVTATFVAAAILTAAAAQTPDAQKPPGYVADAQSTHSAREVAAARQVYRQACQRHQSAGFCQCLAAGVAQAMPPHLVRQASRGIGERLAATSGAAGASTFYAADARSGLDDPTARIAEVEGHYANVCQQLRR